MTNKRLGRVGDSPLIGAGTYADNRSCAVSGTGHGEYFIRSVLAHEVAAQMRLGGKSLAEAAQAALAELEILGGQGGLIALDAQGNCVLPFNTGRMYRGWLSLDGTRATQIYS
jgi:beta-aspartyl-peptidase (threonine type)